jgi:hypothetical protein
MEKTLGGTTTTVRPPRRRVMVFEEVDLLIFALIKGTVLDSEPLKT